MELTWHGHSTWYVTVGDTDLLIDPFFDNPHTSLDPSDVNDPDYVLLTHGHADHIAHAGEFTDATIVGTPELTGFIEDEHGAGNTTGMNLGGTIECGDAYVTMHQAQHTNGINTGYEHDAGVPAGYVVSDTKPTQVSDGDSTAFYHAGDTSLMTEMRDVIGPYLEPDAVAVPCRRPLHDGTDAGGHRRRLGRRRPRVPDALRHVPANRNRRAGLRGRGCWHRKRR